MNDDTELLALGDKTLQSNADLRLHQALSRFNRERLQPVALDNVLSARGESLQDQSAASQRALGIALQREVPLRLAEAAFVSQARSQVVEMAAQAPRDADAFVAWFESLKMTGPGQGDRLFDWLAHSATLEQMRWFIGQELAGEAGFDDLVALTQLKLPQRAKLELARNYWDEMGRGTVGGMHGPMLDRLAHALDAGGDPIVWESLALANLLVALAINRSYAYHSIGALGVIELTAPTRAVLVNEGLRRLGFAEGPRHYFAIHATLDVKHSEAWNREVLHPLVKADPSLAQPIAEGALMRLLAGARCFERYRQHLMP